MAKIFVALHDDSVARQMFLSQTLSHGTATFILKVKVSVFLVLWVSLTGCNICQGAIFVSVQYRIILHTCITLIYMAIYLSHKIMFYTADYITTGF